MRRAARIDDNQPEIVEALRDAGCLVHSTAALGKGFPDLLVGYDGQLCLLEVKDGSKVPSKRRLTPDETAWFNRWYEYRVYVVESVEDALEAVIKQQRRQQ